MNERLRLAKQLLKDDGVIFVSIDDAEQAYLKVLMDEIFGEENFVGNLIWRKKNTGGGSDKINLETETEFILIYAISKEKLVINTKSIDKDKYTLEDEYIETRGKFYLTNLDHSCSKSTFQYSESLDYLIKAPDGSEFKNYNNVKKPKSYSYTIGKELFNFLNNNGFIEIQQKLDKNGTKYWKAYRKSYEKVIVDRRKPYEILERTEGNNFNNLIDEGNLTTSSGKRILISVIDNKDFSFPKPVGLIKYITGLIRNKNARILDFFAGSGTTGHAVLELNKEDGGNRTYTLVTNNENNIATNVTYERLFRINNGVGTNGEDFKWAKDNEPYKSNLNVYNIKHQDVSIFNNQLSIDNLTNQIKNVLIDFGIGEQYLKNLQEIDILNSLLALKPQIKDEDATN